MGVMKGSPVSRRPPRGGGGGGMGGGGSGGLPGGAGASGSGGLPGDGKFFLQESGGMAVPATLSEVQAIEVEGCTSVPRATPRKRKSAEGRTGPARSSTAEGSPGGDGGGGNIFRMLCTNYEDEGNVPPGSGAVWDSDGDIAATTNGHGGGGGGNIYSGFRMLCTKKGDEGNIPPGSIAVWESNGNIAATTNGDGGGGGGGGGGNIFSGFRLLCTNCEDEGFTQYEEKIKSLGGKIVSGFYYTSATHIIIEGNIPPGARVIWESDGKILTTTNWVDSCFKDMCLAPYPVKDLTENILSTTDVTPLAKINSIARSSTSDGKLSKLNHRSSRPRSLRRKLKFSPCGLYHNLLSCEADNRRSEILYDYALRFRMYENRTLPGQRIFFEVCKVSTKLIVGGCYSQMACLHLQGKSLGGRLTSKSFRIYPDDTVMIDVLESELVDYTDSEGDKDYSSFVKMVREEVFHNQNIPVDLIEWLYIMSKGVRECHPNVLSNFIYLMEPFQSFGAFVTMYLLFSSIQDTDRWADLFSALRHYDNRKVAKSSIMQETLDYTDQNGYLVQYETDVRGLLRLLWNCSKHRAKRMVKSFVLMVLVEYRSLLSDLQRALYDGGYLSHLKLKGQQ